MPAYGCSDDWVQCYQNADAQLKVVNAAKMCSQISSLESGGAGGMFPPAGGWKPTENGWMKAEDVQELASSPKGRASRAPFAGHRAPFHFI